MDDEILAKAKIEMVDGPRMGRRNAQNHVATSQTDLLRMMQIFAQVSYFDNTPKEVFYSF